MPTVWSYKGLNITPKRIEALRWVKDHPGHYVDALATAVLTSVRRRDNGSGYKAQMATRAGAGCVTPLIKIGLVAKERTDYGWGKVTLTDQGKSLVDTIDAVEAAGKETT